MPSLVLNDQGDVVVIENITKIHADTGTHTLTYYHVDGTSTAYTYASNAAMDTALQGFLQAANAGKPIVQMAPATPPAGLTIVSITPNTGPVTGGTSCVIVGTGFTAQPTMYCQIGTMVGSVSVTDDTHMTIITPNYSAVGGVAGAQDVQISYYHDLSAAQTLAGGFTYT